MADSMADSMADGFETEAKELQLVLRVALSSLGPGGSLQGVQANASTGVGVLSSASRRLFESLRLRTWHARALVRLAVQPQAEAFGDGGLVAAALASALVQAVRSGSESALDRFRMRHIDAVASCCGVDPVSVISEGALRSIRSHVGKLEGIHLRRLCRKTVVSFEPLADAKTQTVVLTAPNEIAMGELAHSCRSAVAVLTSALQSPYVTPGAGFFEMVLSSTVRSQLPSPTDRGRRLERSVLESLAGTLETIAGKLGGGDSGDREASLRRSWEFATRRGLLDLVMSKLAAVEYAVDAACNLSQVDCTLVCQ